MFHRHQWVELERTFAPPVQRLKMLELTASPEFLVFMERMTFGVTTVTLRCHSCGDRKTYAILGDASNPSRLETTHS